MGLGSRTQEGTNKKKVALGFWRHEVQVALQLVPLVRSHFGSRSSVGDVAPRASFACLLFVRPRLAQSARLLAAVCDHG